MKPKTIYDLIVLLSNISQEHGGDTEFEFQDYDCEEKEVCIILENIHNYTDSSRSTKKIIIRDL